MKNMTVTELKKNEGVIRQELLEMRFDHAVGKLLNSSAMKTKRRELARILTAVKAIKVEA